MSEAEKRRRFYYKQTRNKWLFIGAMILAGAILVSLIFTALFFSFNRSTFIEYKEKGDVEYLVFLNDNDVFKETCLDADRMYVTSLIDRVWLNFKYDLHMAKAVQYSYTYSADARIVIKDRTTKTLIYEGRLDHNTQMLVPEQTVTMQQAEERLSFTQPLTIEYDQYNEKARSIVNALSLKDVTCTLEVEMDIRVNGSAEELEQDKENAYTFALSMPLNTEKATFARTSSVPTGASKLITANKGVARVVFLVLTIIFVSLTALFAIAYVAFIYLTRNTDINYTRKVNKVVSNYKSYIQKIVSPFDMTEYQLLVVDSFVELLEIRDTIQSPILMYENEDKTCTTFMIPTNTKLLYVFEIKVADYDDLYGYTKTIEANTILDLDGENELTILEDVDADELVEALKQPDVPLSDLVYDEEEDIEPESEEDAVEVVGVAWPQRRKIYNYDPNGGQVESGDIILVPDKDEKQNKDVIRKATVAKANRVVQSESVEHPLKKVIGIFKRKAEEVLMPKDESEENENSDQ